MELVTYTDMVTKMGNDLDITDERFISQTELLGYFNEAIDDAETLIHNLHHEDKYFLTDGSFSWVASTQEYVMPTDIYANKIRGMWYINGAQKYEIIRITRLEDTFYVQSGDSYRYLIVNSTAGGVKVRFYPTPAETSTNAKLFYIRNMKRMTTSAAATNVCEVPEAANFVYAHAKWNVTKKTRRADLIADAKADRDLQYSLMSTNLKEMVADENTLVPLDLSFYSGQDGIYYGR